MEAKKGSQHALIPHEFVKRPRMPPEMHVGLPHLHGLILRHLLDELILLFACLPSPLQSTPRESHGQVYRFAASDDGASWDVRVHDVLAPEREPETTPRFSP